MADNTPKPEKVKKVMTPEQLEKLKIARERALEVRRKNASEKALIKELAVTEKERVITEVKEKLYSLKPKAPDQKEPKVEIIEPDACALVKVKKEKKKIVIEQHSSDDENDHEVVYIRRKKEPSSGVIPQNIVTQATQPIHQLPPRPSPYQKHYDTMFGRNPNSQRF